MHAHIAIHVIPTHSLTTKSEVLCTHTSIVICIRHVYGLWENDKIEQVKVNLFHSMVFTQFYDLDFDGRHAPLYVHLIFLHHC